MSTDLRQSFLMPTLSDLSDGSCWLGPSGSFRFFRRLHRHYYPERWMSDPGRQGAVGYYPFESPIPATSLFSRETPSVEHTYCYFVKGYNQVFEAYQDIPHRIDAVGASGFTMLAVFTGTFRVDRAPLRIDLSFMRRSDPMPTISNTRRRTAGRFLRAMRLSPGQSALWGGEVLIRTSDTEESALGAVLIEMQMRRPDIAELFEACCRTYPAYYIGRAERKPAMMLGFGSEDPPALLAIDQSDDEAILQEEARRRDRWRQAEKVHEPFARSR